MHPELVGLVEEIRCGESALPLAVLLELIRDWLLDHEAMCREINLDDPEVVLVIPEQIEEATWVNTVHTARNRVIGGCCDEYVVSHAQVGHWPQGVILKPREIHVPDLPRLLRLGAVVHRPLYEVDPHGFFDPEGNWRPFPIEQRTLPHYGSNSRGIRLMDWHRRHFHVGYLVRDAMAGGLVPQDIWQARNHIVARRVGSLLTGLV